jgi:hypothetical protein
MKKYRTCFVKVLIALFSVMLFASCNEKEDDPKSTACDIVSFKVRATPWVINGADITYNYSSATLPTPLTPTIEVSPGATVSPPSGIEQNNFFKDGGVEYIVTAEDRVTIKKYTARAIRTKYSNCQILTFRAGGAIWDINEDEGLITHSFPSTTAPESFIPTIDLSVGAKISPLESEAQNFFSETGVRYTVTAEDGSNTKVYTVKARNNSADCDILSFSVNGEEWNINRQELSITHVFSNNVTPGILTPVITVSNGATIVPLSGTAQDFFAEAGVQYTVRAEDTLVEKTYTVSARIASSASAIVSFRAGGVDWNIDGTDISYIFPEGTTKGYLIPNIPVSPGAAIDPPATEAQDFFAAPVTYTVTSEDGSAQTVYTVKSYVHEKYGDEDRKNWVAFSRHGHLNGWNDGYGTQTLWHGGCPMLAIDDDPASGWHSFLSHNKEDLPQVLIIDLKASKQVSKISGTGGDLYNMELYLTNDLSINGYSSHTIDWNDTDWYQHDYDSWYNPLIEAIPATVPASWGTPIAEGITPSNNSFSFSLPKPAQGQYLILRFTDNGNDWSTYTAISNVEIYYIF